MSTRSFAELFVGLMFIFQGCLSMYVEVTPRQAIVLPKQNMTILCSVGVKLQYCRIQIPGLNPLNLMSGSSAEQGVTYFGAGLEAGQCGARVASIEEKHNGIVQCYLGVIGETSESLGKMELTVARAPKAPELDLSPGTDSFRVYKAGDTLQASCIVKDGRPVANISWFLDEEQVLDGLSMPTIIDVAKDDLHSIIQNLTRKLPPSDNGKKLRCVAGHPALSEHNRETFRQLDVKYAPLSVDNPIDKFGYELGKPGIISVEINANPRPRLQWQVRDQVIKEGGLDPAGQLEAENAKEEGKGKYLATLRIASITKQDTETQFRLTAYNDQGSTEYIVIISTSPEPEGLELGVGYIIGIVVALLLLLFLIFLVVFARATGRWCFSDRTPRYAGETSDTESADVRKESKFKVPKINLPAVFKRNKDRVATEEETAKPMETEEQKVPLEETILQPKPEGVVYAELDLVAQNLRPLVKNDDDKTEYAEIIYTKTPEEEEADKPEAETKKS